MDDAVEAFKREAEPPPRQVRRSDGFTLIELLVAIAIAAILAGMAIVSLNVGGSDERLEDEARRLYQLTRIASDDAVFKTAQYGVRFTETEYTFYRLEKSADDKSPGDQDSDDKRRWLAIEDHAQLRSREWPEELAVDVFVEGLPIALDQQRDAAAEAKDKKLRPHIMFLSNGEVMPNAEIHLSSTETEKTWRVGIDDDGLLAVKPLLE